MKKNIPILLLMSMLAGNGAFAQEIEPVKHEFNGFAVVKIDNYIATVPVKADLASKAECLKYPAKFSQGITAVRAPDGVTSAEIFQQFQDQGAVILYGACSQI